MVGSSPLKGIKNINELLPASAKEAKNFGLIQKAKVVKETAGIVSQINSANNLIENSKKILHNPNDLEKNKDIPEDGFNQ